MKSWVRHGDRQGIRRPDPGNEPQRSVPVGAISIDAIPLRDFFAGQALAGWYSGGGGLPNEAHCEGYAKHFYAMADAMLKARTQEPKA